MFKKVLLAGVLVLALLPGCTDQAKSASSAGVTAADFTLQDLNGRNVRLSDFRGKPVVLEFWATWCPPCRASIPGMEKIYRSFAPKGLTILAVSLDDGGWNDVRAFVKDYGITYTVLKGDEDVADKYQVRSIPLVLVIDKQGRVIRRYLGFGYDEELEQDLKAVL